MAGTCWLNEDCIAGYKHEGECRFPSWYPDSSVASPTKTFKRWKFAHLFECTCHERVMILRTGHHDRSCPSFRPARRTTSCAGCDCEPGTTCDSQIRCGRCNASKTTCDAFKSRNDGSQCCKTCDHRG